jgi:hypothetical protein
MRVYINTFYLLNDFQNFILMRWSYTFNEHKMFNTVHDIKGIVSRDGVSTEAFGV